MSPKSGHAKGSIAIVGRTLGEYSEKDDSAQVAASYGGERFDPAQSGDGFSYRVLTSTVKSLSYHYDPEAEQTNTVKILI